MIYQCLGLLAVALALLGVALPLLPTVPFLLLAVYFFARSNPEWERRIVEHPRFGPPVRAWRERGVIGVKGKAAAIVAFAASAMLGLTLLEWPWSVAPLAIGIVGGTWILSRPSE